MQRFATDNFPCVRLKNLPLRPVARLTSVDALLYNGGVDRLILHCDLNNFYASVECLRHPEWKTVPLAVSGNPEKRHGVVLAKNELAKKFGVKTGDVIWEAKQKAPGLVLVPPHFDDYMRISKQVFTIYTHYTPFVEPFGADECWLDCTGCENLFGDGQQIADTLRAVIRRETGLTISVGVSFNKVFAKLGSDLKKPDATTVITRENFRELLWNLPANDLLMVGKHSYEKLKRLNIVTIGDLAQADDGLLKRTFGVNGLKMKESAAGENADPVRQYDQNRTVESVGHGMTATRDIVTDEDLSVIIYYLSEMVGARMRKQGFKGSGVSVHLRDVELETISRQTKIAPTATDTDIAQAALALARKSRGSLPLRTVTVSVFDLSRAGDKTQLSMFEPDDKKNERLQAALDEIRARYGKTAVVRANLIESDFVYDKTDAEDFLPFQR